MPDQPIFPTLPRCRVNTASRKTFFYEIDRYTILTAARGRFGDCILLNLLFKEFLTKHNEDKNTVQKASELSPRVQSARFETIEHHTSMHFVCECVSELMWTWCFFCPVFIEIWRVDQLFLFVYTVKFF